MHRIVGTCHVLFLFLSLFLCLQLWICTYIIYIVRYIWVLFMIRIRLKSTLRGNADMFSQQMRSLLTVICSLVLSVSVRGGSSRSLPLPRSACLYMYIELGIHIAAVRGSGGIVVWNQMEVYCLNCWSPCIDKRKTHAHTYIKNSFETNMYINGTIDDELLHKREHVKIHKFFLK